MEVGWRAGIKANTCGCFALFHCRLVETSGEVSLQLREGNGCLSRCLEGRRRVLLVLGVPLVHVLGRSLAAADTHVPVLAADDQFEVAVPLDDDLPHALLHRHDGLARISGDYPECKYPTGERCEREHL